MSASATSSEPGEGLPVWLGGVLWALAFVWLALIAHYIFRGYPLSADEHQYLAQAQLFTSGEVHFSGDLPRRWLQLHSKVIEGAWFSKYPPGASLIQAIFLALGNVALAGPFAGSLCLVLIYRLIKPWSSCVSALTVSAFLALNPVFWGYAASYFSHIYALLFGLALLVCTIASDRSWRLTTAAGAAAATVMLVLIRPADAACYIGALSLAVLALRRWRLLWAPLSGLLIGALVLSTYNYVVADVFRPGLYGGDFFTLIPFLKGELELSFIGYLDWWGQGLHHRTGHLLWTWYIRLNGYLVPLVSLAGLLAIRRVPPLTAGLTLGVTCVFLGFYSFLPFMGWPFYGLRYQVPVVIGQSIALAALLAWIEDTIVSRPTLNRHARLVFFLLMAPLLGWQGFATQQRLEDYNARFGVVETFFRTVSRECSDNSVVNFAAPLRGRRYFILFSTLARVSDPKGRVVATRGLDGHYILAGTRFKPEQHTKWMLRHPEWQMCDLDQDHLDLLIKEATTTIKSTWFFVPFQGDRKQPPPRR